MNDPLINLQDTVQKNADFSGELATEGEIQTKTIAFTRPVIRAKVIAKHETGKNAYGSVTDVNVNDNCVTVKMAFQGDVGSHYETVVVLNVAM